MRGKQFNKQNKLLALSLAVLLAPSMAGAVLKCPSDLTVKSGACAQLPPAQQSQCYADCAQAAQDCQDAQKTCKTGEGAEKGHIAEGAAENAGAGAASSGRQGAKGAQGPNASNMCSGQKTNQNRANDGQPIPPAMQKCQQSAMKCKDPSGPKAGQEAGRNAAENSAENAQRAADAAEMGKKCEDSAKNEDKMPSIPQMPPPEKKEDETPPSDIAQSELGTKAAEVKNGPLETVKLDPYKAGGDISMSTAGPLASAAAPAVPHISGNSGSGLSGNSESGFESLGHSDGEEMKAANSGAIGGASGGGLGTSDSSAKPENGIAEADIKPADKGSFELSNGGKSVLGLKGGKGDDEISVDALAGLHKKATAGADAAKDSARTLAGAQAANATHVGQDTSIFKMVKSRYRELRKIGEI